MPNIKNVRSCHLSIRASSDILHPFWPAPFSPTLDSSLSLSPTPRMASRGPSWSNSTPPPPRSYSPHATPNRFQPPDHSLWSGLQPTELRSTDSGLIEARPFPPLRTGSVVSRRPPTLNDLPRRPGSAQSFRRPLSAGRDAPDRSPSIDSCNPPSRSNSISGRSRSQAPAASRGTVDRTVLENLYETYIVTPLASGCFQLSAVLRPFLDQLRSSNLEVEGPLCLILEWLKRDFLLWRDSRLSSGWAAERTSKQWRFSDDIEKTDKILPSVGAVFDSSRQKSLAKDITRYQEMGELGYKSETGVELAARFDFDSQDELYAWLERNFTFNAWTKVEDRYERRRDTTWRAYVEGRPPWLAHTGGTGAVGIPPKDMMSTWHNEALRNVFENSVLRSERARVLRSERARPSADEGKLYGGDSASWLLYDSSPGVIASQETRRSLAQGASKGAYYAQQRSASNLRIARSPSR